MNVDESLLRAFIEGGLDNAGFSHARHVQVAWMLSERYPRAQAFEILTAGIRGIAARAGSPEAFHHTITRAWFELIASVADPDDYPELLDKTLLGRYYSVARLAAGRERWLEPDLHPLRLPAPLARTPEPEQFSVLAGLPTSVMVMAVHAHGVVHATTVSSFSLVSQDPMLIGLSLADGSRALRLLRDAGSFALSALADDQGDVGTRFADGNRPDGPTQFAGIPHHLSPYGPLIEDAAAWIGCRFAGEQAWGDHHLVIGQVGFAEGSGRRPLLQARSRSSSSGRCAR
jgi:flavin reductase (DIM6/NTAB) family NADH-FMN oxidoreductase RutF